jgi:hypothetical protein
MSVVFAVLIEVADFRMIGKMLLTLRRRIEADRSAEGPG